MAKAVSQSINTKALFHAALTVILLTLCVIFFFIIRETILNKHDKQAFQMTEFFITNAYNEATKTAGEPLYLDKKEYCYWHTPYEFADQKLYCTLDFAGYYRVDQNVSKVLADAVDSYFRKNINTGFQQIAQQSDPSSVKSLFPNQKIYALSNMECAAGIYYPERSTNWAELPKREFDSNDVIDISISCSREVQNPLFYLKNEKFGS